MVVNIGKLARIFFVFVVVLLSLQYGWKQARGSAVERAVIHSATVGVSTWAIQSLTPSLNVKGFESRILSDKGGINILNGCEGTEVLFLLIAAMMAFKSNWRHRLAGILIATLAIYLLNQVRVLVLFYTFLHDRSLFAHIHGVFAPLALICAGMALFLAWCARAEGQARDQQNVVAG
jgi:exosortase family protein XrtM